MRVLYDGTPTTYEVLQGFESSKFEATSCTRAAQKLPASSVEAAEESYAEYLGALERESHPELLVFAPEVSIASGENHDIAQTLIETGINEDTVTLAEKTGPEYVVETKEEVTSHTEEVIYVFTCGGFQFLYSPIWCSVWSLSKGQCCSCGVLVGEASCWSSFFWQYASYKRSVAKSTVLVSLC